MIFLSLLNWTNWAGLGWIRIMYFFCLGFFSLFYLIAMIVGFVSGPVGIAVAILIIPLLWLLTLLTCRIVAEVSTTILLMPFIMNKSNSNHASVQMNNGPYHPSAPVVYNGTGANYAQV